MKTAKISIDPVGRPTIEMDGFVGGECKHRSKPILDALGVSEAEVRTVEKPEMHMVDTNEQEDTLTHY